jgi:CBS domain-containing protein
MELCVQEIMSDNVVTIEAVQSVKNAARLMSKFGISGLVVLDEGNLVGILTERDILTRVVASGQDPQESRVREVMSEPVIVVNPAMPLENAVDIMFQERIKKLPVVDKEDERLKLVGILSITDIARLQPKLLEGLKALGHMNDAALEANAEFYIR